MRGILVYVENGLWVSGVVIHGIGFDWGVLMLDDQQYEVFWSYDGDEHWSIIETDIDRCLACSAAHLIRR